MLIVERSFYSDLPSGRYLSLSGAHMRLQMGRLDKVCIYSGEAVNNSGILY